KVEVEIPVVLTGEPIAPAAAFVDLQTLTLLVDALNMPEQVEVDVEGSEDGFQVFAGDVTLPEGSELVSDVELLVASVALPRIDETEDEEGEESEASAEPDRKSTRLNSSHVSNSYAVCCLNKKRKRRR